MKTEIAVLSGKEPFGVRLELSAREAELIADRLNESRDFDKRIARMADDIYNVNNNVKNLNQQQDQVIQPKGKAKPNG